MEKVNVSLQVIPSVDEKDIYPVVDKVLEYIKSTGVKHEVGPMETTMEGDYDKLMEIVKKSQQICVENGAKRVLAVIKVDYKPGGVTINEKIYKYRK